MKAVILDQATFGPQQPDWLGILTLPFDWQCYAGTEPDEVADRIAEVDVVLTNKVVLSAAHLAQAHALKYIGVLATGVNNIDLDAARAQGIQVQNVAGYGTASVVQHTLLLMLALAGNFVAYQQQVRQGDWQRSPMFCLMDHPMRELSGKRLVILGNGELGQGVAKIAAALDMEVIIATRPGQKASAARPEFDALLPSADFVSLHCLYSPQTHHLINGERLALMASHGYLINTSRGPLIDENALREALQRGQIAGAALDVLTTEPPKADNSLLAYQGNNLIITPHNAWATQEAKQRLVDIAQRHLRAFVESR